jgi:hypothetical protein
MFPPLWKCNPTTPLNQIAYEFILIGLRIRLLRNIDNTDTVEFANENINGLRTEITEVDFEVSSTSFDTFLKEPLKELEEKEDNEQIGSGLGSKLREAMRTVENTVFAEASIKKIYSVPQRRFNSKYLSEEPNKLLKEDVFSDLSDIAKFDFKSACRCILYGEATASAFHILRATEDTLKHYYFHYKKTKRLKKPMWGPMTTELKNKKTNKPDSTILSALDVVRISYRNPTQHPQATYDIESAQDLLGVCIDLINKMINDIKK